MALNSAPQLPLAPGAIGIFGGSFDPVHLAHLTLARTARDQLGLSELRWMPAGHPWQKVGQPMIAAHHRRAMVECLIEGEPGFVLDDTELRDSGPSYTIATLERLQQLHPDVAEWVLVIGQDQYARLHTWQRWQDVLKTVTLAVAARAGQEVRAAAEVEAVAHRMVRLDMPAMEISSTLVRDRVLRGEDITPMVGDGVARYIAQHCLYSEY